jgi:DNA-binding FadR family transcriptional regulator
MSVSDAVFDQLRDAIVLGKLETGSTLPSERALAEILKVSRGAVREARKRLEQAGLVSIQRGGTTQVLDFRGSARLDLVTRLLGNGPGGLDLKVARSVIELRTAITPDIARLAALRRGPGAGREISALLQKMREASDDVARIQELGQDFWDLLVRLSDNVAYQLIFNTIREVFERYRSVIQPLLAARYRNLATIEAIADAVIRGDAKAAFEAAHTHASPISARLYEEIDALGGPGTTTRPR